MQSAPNYFQTSQARDQIAGKSILAQIMAREKLHVEHSRNAKTAAFDCVARHLILPMYTGMTEDQRVMLITHEVGHAKYTPPLDQALTSRIDPKNPNRAAKYLNIVEDARIERLMKDCYPGLRPTFVKAYKELTQSKRFTNIREDQAHLLPFIDRINIHAKIGFMWKVPFSAKEIALVAKVHRTQTIEDVVTVTQEIYALAREQAAQQKQEKKQDQPDQPKNRPNSKKKPSENEAEPDDSEELEGQGGKGEQNSMDTEVGEGNESEEDSDPSEDGDSEGDSESKNDSSEDGDKEGKDSDSDSSEDGDADGDSESESNADGESKPSTKAPKKSKGSAGKTKDNDDPQAEPEEATTHDILNMPDQKNDAASSISTIHYNANAAYLDKIIVPWKTVQAKLRASSTRNAKRSRGVTTMESSMKWISEQRKEIEYMARQFDMKKAALSFARLRESDSGRIDPLRLHAYKTSDQIFKKNLVQNNGKNHGMVFFIDWSSSMMGSAEGTLLQTLLMVMYCKRIRIPFDVYAFTTGSSDVQFEETKLSELSIQHNACGPSYMSSTVLYQLISSDMPASAYNEALRNLHNIAVNHTNGFGTMGGTPLNETIMAAMKIVPAFRKKHKVEIMNVVFLTDGDGHSTFPYVYGSQEVFLRETNTGLNTKIVNGNVTGTLLENLGDMTDSNVLGFFLTSDYTIESTISSRLNPKDPKVLPITTYREQFRADRCVRIPCLGYKDFFILPNSSLNVLGTHGQIDEAVARSNSSEDRIQTIKTMTAATQKNRVLLDKFVASMSQH